MKSGEFMSKEEQKITKELNSRMKEFKAALKDENKKFELMDNIPASEGIIRFEIILPSQNPEEFVDGLFLYMNDEGVIVNAEYYYRDKSEVEVINIPEDYLPVITELFSDLFISEVEE
ncbi:MAG: hypothetical protein BWY74_01671 [Firmicutes bacterium ADurb.Bin419]|jgi:hypothetical protein|nr:MAG: hypothetical protein BWY74_01671 [Firmicutes bacterium ADurb.Bin419]